MNSSARLTLVILLICVLGTALLLDGRKTKTPGEPGDDKVAQIDPLSIKGQKRTETWVVRPGKKVAPQPQRTLTPRISKRPVAGNQSVKVAPLQPGKRVIPAAGDAGSYTVREGDNLWAISKRVYGSFGHVRTLKKANPQLAGRYLKVGEKLVTPAVNQAAMRQLKQIERAQKAGRGSRANPARSKTTTRRNSSGRLVHVVRPGDKLWNLASRYLGSGSRHWQIYEANKSRIVNPDRLKVGVTLVIPAR